MRLEDMHIHYDIFEKVESNGFIVICTPIYCDIKHLRREYVKGQAYWFLVWVFHQDGTLIQDQRKVLGFNNIIVDDITADINEKLLKEALCIS
jgi:hypothetical protein